MSRDPSSSRALPSLRHAAPWLGVVATLLGVLAMSARGYALSRWVARELKRSDFRPDRIADVGTNTGFGAFYFKYWLDRK